MPNNMIGTEWIHCIKYDDIEFDEPLKRPLFAGAGECNENTSPTTSRMGGESFGGTPNAGTLGGAGILGNANGINGGLGGGGGGNDRSLSSSIAVGIGGNGCVLIFA